MNYFVLDVTGRFYARQPQMHNYYNLGISIASLRILSSKALMLDCSKSLVHLGSILTLGKLLSPYTTKENPYDRKSVQEIMGVHLGIATKFFWWSLVCTDKFDIHEFDSTSKTAVWESGRHFFVGEIEFYCY